MRRFISAILAFVLMPHLAMADTIVLRNGQVHSGTIANRADVRASPLERDTIAILAESQDGQPSLERFEILDIDYLVFHDGDAVQAVDVASLLRDALRERGQPESPAPRASTARKDISGGVVALVFGLAALGIGIFVKFGDEKLTVTNDSVDYDEKTHNALNYSLIAIGGLSSVIGLAVISSAGNGSGGTPRASSAGEFRLGLGVQF